MPHSSPPEPTRYPRQSSQTRYRRSTSRAGSIAGWIQVTGRTLILDGAHTSESISALVETVAAEYGSIRFPVILGVLADKPAADFFLALAPIVDRIICPDQANPRAIPASDLCAAARHLGLDAATALSLRAALGTIGRGPEPVLVTGSFGLVADALRAMKEPAGCGA